MPRPTFTCQQCGKEFTTYPSRTRRFCSHQCYWIAMKGNAPLPIGKIKARERISVNCSRCGIEFELIPAKVKRSTNLYCSKECSGIATGIASHLKLLQEHGPTDIEQIMMKALNSRNIAHEFQFLIAKKFLCDFGFPAAHLVVECDGTYWHSLPKTIRNDRAKDAYLRKCGYTILRFSDKQIKANIDDCIGQIVDHLESAPSIAR